MGYHIYPTQDITGHGCRVAVHDVHIVNSSNGDLGKPTHEKSVYTGRLQLETSCWWYFLTCAAGPRSYLTEYTKKAGKMKTRKHTQNNQEK